MLKTKRCELAHANVNVESNWVNQGLRGFRKENGRKEEREVEKLEYQKESDFFPFTRQPGVCVCGGSWC